MRTILVTGGAGFIGSNFIRKMLEWHPEDTIINLDALTYAGNLANLNDVVGNPRHVFIRGDIRDRGCLESVFSKYGIGTVVNFAAESHVDRSIDDPEVFLTTNILGTQALLDTAKKHWKLEPDNKYSRGYREGGAILTGFHR